MKALYQGCGAFGHPRYADCFVQTINMNSARRTLTQLRRDACAHWHTSGLGLYNHILDVWGGRPDLEDALDEESTSIVNANYIVFASRYLHDNVHVYWYFDRNGQFGALRFDQDEWQENIWKIESLADIVPPDSDGLDAAQRLAYTVDEVAGFGGCKDTFPCMTLSELVEREFTALVKDLKNWY